MDGNARGRIAKILYMTSPQHDMATTPRSPAIPEAVQRIYEQQYITLPLLVALSRLQDQLKVAGNTEARVNRVLYNKTSELSWGRQSPQLTPTPSPSPSPQSLLHRNLPSFSTPPDNLSQRENSAFPSPTKPAAPRRSRHKLSSRTPLQPSHIMLRRSRVRESRAVERKFWELDASGRRARRIDIWAEYTRRKRDISVK
ncbi:hypothetical protein J1614_000067 [Plenodomus biglobosus]|nr:hypothetical protein J1614_000067 [Plenodomus biglobosus]